MHKKCHIAKKWLSSDSLGWDHDKYFCVDELYAHVSCFLFINSVHDFGEELFRIRVQIFYLLSPGLLRQYLAMFWVIPTFFQLFQLNRDDQNYIIHLHQLLSTFKNRQTSSDGKQNSINNFNTQKLMKNNKDRFKIEIVKKRERRQPKTAQPGTRNRQPMPDKKFEQTAGDDHAYQSAPIQNASTAQDLQSENRENPIVFQNHKLAKIRKSKKSHKVICEDRSTQLSPAKTTHIGNTYTIDEEFFANYDKISEQIFSHEDENYPEKAFQEKGQKVNFQKAVNRTISTSKFESIKGERMSAKVSSSSALFLLQNFKKVDLKEKSSTINFVQKNKKSEQITAIRCQSITLLSAPPCKKINQPLIPSKLLKSRAGSDHYSRKKVKINKITTSNVVSGSNRIMSFNMNIDPDILYMKKLKNYLDFLFKINFSNRMYVRVSLKEVDKQPQFQRYRAYIGPGNNSELIKNILRKRFWFQIVGADCCDDEDYDQNKKIYFRWTTQPEQKVHKKQKFAFCCEEDLGFISNVRNSHLRVLATRPIPLLQRKPDRKITEEIYQQNLKIMSKEDAYRVEEYILSDSHIVPYEEPDFSSLCISNHLPFNYCIGEKTKLFKLMFHFYKNFKKRDPFEFLPLTYSIRNCDDPEFRRFLRDQKARDPSDEKIWIVKPGEGTNRGQGIALSRADKISQVIKDKGERETYIIQEYLDQPLLYHGRKFDIRHFLLITSVNGFLKGYWFKEGYIRTSSEYFSSSHDSLSNKFIHLTNDAIQKQSPSYGKFQVANKVSYCEFQRYLDSIFQSKRVDFEGQIVNKKMKEIIQDVLMASYSTLDYQRRSSNFQLFGIDFMLGRDLKPWLIQINSNPCLQANCPLLTRIIPHILQSSLRIGLDPLLPPPCHFPIKQRPSLSEHYIKNLKMQLIFDECSFQKAIPPNYDILQVDSQDII